MKTQYLFLILATALFNCVGPKPPDAPPKPIFPEEIAIKGIIGGIEYRENFQIKDIVLHFSEFNQIHKIKSGDKVIISIDTNLIKNKNLFIMSRYDENSDTITIGLFDRYGEEPITLSKKCEVIEIRGKNEIPPIRVTSDLKPEQIVLTPIFDDSCYKIGYQIRYGSIERGCGEVAGPVWKRFNNCVKEKKREKDPTCWEEAWFGVKCP